MKAKVKTVFKGFDYMHCDDFAKYLSDMAAKGWHFKEWGAGLKFEKGVPEQAVYAVEVFQKASENDMRPEPNTQEFAEYCESAGWKFVDAKQKFCIFKRIDEDATEMFTPEERLNNAMKGTFSGTAIVLLVLYGINAALRWGQLISWFESYIFSGSFFFGIAAWTIMFVGQLLIMGYALYKYIRLKKQVKSGESIYIGNRQDGKYHFNIKDLYMLLLVLVLIYYFFIMDRIGLIILNGAIVVGTLGFAFVLNKVRPDRDTSIGVQVVFSMVLMVSIVAFSMMIFTEDGETGDSGGGEIPLTIIDYRDCIDDVVEDTSLYQDRNFLGSRLSYLVYGEEEAIYYYVYKSKYTWILDRIWEDEVDEKIINEEVEDYTASWGAQKALRDSKGTYYVRYANSVLIFDDDEEVYLSEEQIAVILEKLELR